jgi:hypothetical protein
MAYNRPRGEVPGSTPNPQTETEIIQSKHGWPSHTREWGRVREWSSSPNFEFRVKFKIRGNEAALNVGGHSAPNAFRTHEVSGYQLTSGKHQRGTGALEHDVPLLEPE